MGSDESHFNVPLTVRDKVPRQCPETTILEEKGEPKRIRTEVPLLTSLPVRSNRLWWISSYTLYLLECRVREITEGDAVRVTSVDRRQFPLFIYGSAFHNVTFLHVCVFVLFLKKISQRI